MLVKEASRISLREPQASPDEPVDIPENLKPWVVSSLGWSLTDVIVVNRSVDHWSFLDQDVTWKLSGFRENVTTFEEYSGITATTELLTACPEA